jgi:hypothetical protein
MLNIEYFPEISKSDQHFTTLSMGLLAIGIHWYMYVLVCGFRLKKPRELIIIKLVLLKLEQR